jgi:hypothetical protein
MPPPSEPPSPAADRYAFAVSVYHLLFGAHPTRDHHRTTFQTAQDRTTDAIAVASGAWRRPTTLPPSAIPGDLRGADLTGLEALFMTAFSANITARPSDLGVWLGEIRTCCRMDETAQVHITDVSSTSFPPLDEVPFVPPPALPDFTAQQAAGFDKTKPPIPRQWWVRIIRRLKGVKLYKR